MKKILRWASLFLFFIPVLATQVYAKDYEIPELHIEVQVRADGTMHVTEHRTYRYDGSFSWVNYELPKAGYNRIRDIRISEGDSTYINLNTEEPGTFLIEESDHSYNIRWFYDVEDEERVYTVSYILEGAVTTGPEWSEFFWTYAAAGREKSTDSISVTINLPESVSGSDLHPWVREPRTEIESRTTENGFEFRGTDISRRQAVTLRTVFPTDVFNSNISISDSEFSLAWAEMDEERFLAEQQEREEREAYLEQIGIQAGIILVALSLFTFFFFYNRYGKRHKSRVQQRESLMIPGRIQPAIIGWLLASRNTTGSHMFATLLDLAQKGYFTISEKEGEKKIFSKDKPDFIVSSTGKKPEHDMPEWEKSVLKFARERISDGHEKLDELFKLQSSTVSKWYAGWKKSVKEYSLAQGWIDMESYRGLYRNLGVQMFLACLAVAGMFLIHIVVFFALIFTLVAAILSLVIVRRTQKGEDLYKQWKGYWKALFKAKDYQVPDDLLGRHFIYGVAFGIGKKNIEKMFEQNPGAIPLIYWIAVLPGSNRTPAAMASSFSTLTATGTASFGGGSGMGGASAGAAGGGASGGAG